MPKLLREFRHFFFTSSLPEFATSLALKPAQAIASHSSPTMTAHYAIKMDEVMMKIEDRSEIQ